MQARWLSVDDFWRFKKEEVDAWVREGGAALTSDENLKEKS